MISTILSVLVAVSSYSGYAAHYRPGRMEEVASNRGLTQESCMVSGTFEEIGSWVYIESQVTDHAEWCRVTDIPQPDHRQGIIERNIVVEFGWESTPAFCNIDHVNQEPPSACPVIIYHMRDIPVEPPALHLMGDVCQLANRLTPILPNRTPNGLSFPSTDAE